MNSSAAAGTAPGAKVVPEESRARPKWLMPVLLAFVALLLLSISRTWGSDAAGLTGAFTFTAALGLAMPVAVTGLGGLISERSGIVNIGLQGMMVMGTCTAGLVGWKFGPMAALVGGILGGALAGALHALATITLGVNHTVSGVAINILTPGISRYIGSVVFAGHSDGAVTNSPTMSQVNKFTMPILSGGRIGSWSSPDFFGRLGEKNWFLVSDLASIIKGFSTDISAATLIILAVFPIMGYLLWKTPWGLRLRSCGEKPDAADSLGIEVIRTQWTAVILSGALAGLGGAWLVVEVQRYQQGQVALRGFLALACVVFGNWKIGGLLAGAFLFQYPESLPLVAFDQSPRGLILVAAMAFGLFAVWTMYGRKFRDGIVLCVMAAMALIWFKTTHEVDPKITNSFPYAITLLVLVFSSQRQRPPASSGINWRKGS
jgi:general nucleoside transport system permease protein